MNFLGGSFKIGRVFEINIRVHVLFVIWIAFRLITEQTDRVGEALFLGMLFGIVLLHEFGHCFGARSVGGDAHDIMMWPLGGLAYADAPMRPWPQFVTVAAGPAVNVVFCLISGAVLVATVGTAEIISLNPLNSIPYRFTEQWMNVLAMFYRVNYLLLAFNLLPIYPLDGGQILQAIIWPLVGLQRATLIACQVGLAGCVILGLLALKLGGGGMLFFIAIFGGFTCWQRLQAARYGMVVEDPAFRRYDSGRSRRGGWWSRVFKTKRRPRATGSPIEFPNPNPGGWHHQAGGA